MANPSISSLRLTVRRVLEALANHPDRAELKREDTEFEDEDIRQALAFAPASGNILRLLPQFAPVTLAASRLQTKAAEGQTRRN
jgi:hypothetical protein